MPWPTKDLRIRCQEHNRRFPDDATDAMSASAAPEKLSDDGLILHLETAVRNGETYFPFVIQFTAELSRRYWSVREIMES